MFPVAYWLNTAGWTHILVYGVVLPLLVIRARHKGLGAPGGALPIRLRHFRSTAFQLTLLTVGSLAVASTQQLELFPRELPSLRDIFAGLAAYAIAVSFMWPRWRRAVERNARVTHLFMPSTRSERTWWLAVSVLAGVGEEITWRGVQTGLLVAATGSYTVAALLSALSFGGAHAIQGWRSAAIIVGFALGFQALVWFTGSLYVAMAVHIVYDITAGLTYGRLGRELGYRPAEAPTAT